MVILAFQRATDICRLGIFLFADFRKKKCLLQDIQTVIHKKMMQQQRQQTAARRLSAKSGDGALMSSQMTGAPHAQSVFSCALTKGGVDAQRPRSQQQSLFARSAEIHHKNKHLAAAVSCERTMVVDFDSSVADNNNAFACPTGALSKLVNGNCLRSDEQRGGNVNKSRFGGQPSLYGTIPLNGHHSNTDAVARHRLLFAQINAREYKLCREAEQKSCAELIDLVCACPINPETQVGAPQSHVLAITEKFCIDSSNQTLSLESNRTLHPFTLPKNKTWIKSIECVRNEAVQYYYDSVTGCRDLVDGVLHLHIETCEPHHFVPGIKFALLNGSGLVPDPYVDSFEECEQLTDLLCGETPMVEVYDVLDGFRFLASPCKQRAFVQPDCDTNCTQIGPFSSNGSVIAGHMFRRSCYADVNRQHYLQAEIGDERYFFARHEQCNDERGAVGYIACCTTPHQLAQFANQIVESGIWSGIAMHAVREVQYDALQDEYTVQFVGDNEEPIVKRTKNLLGSAVHHSPVSLSRNAMLATAKCPEAKELYLRRALRGGYFFEIKEGVNDRFTLFIHLKECSEVRQKTVTLPPGLFKAAELTDCLSQRLNEAVEMEQECFQFRVDYTLHPTDGLMAWQQCLLSRKSKQDNFPVIGNSPYESHTFGFLVENVQRQHFALDFSRAHKLAATLDFAPRRTNFRLAHGSRPLTKLVEARNCAKQCGQEKSHTPPCKSPKLRALYTASVDQCTGLVTVEQKSLNPLYCGSLDVELVFSHKAACCQDGPDNQLTLPETLLMCEERDQCCDDYSEEDIRCAVSLLENCEQQQAKSEQPEDGSCLPCYECENPCASSSNCSDDISGKHTCSECNSTPCHDSVDPKCRAYIVFQLPHTACDPAVLPLCVNDVVWLTLPGCNSVGVCVTNVWRECGASVKYKIELDYNGRNLYNALRGSKGDQCVPPNLPLRMTIEPIGFNLHMNAAQTEKHMLDNDKPVVRHSAQSAVSKWLGFKNAQTLSNSIVYHSTSTAQSLLDERLILSIPEINQCGRKQPRYGVQSPFDTALTRHYGVLVLNRANGVYEYSNAVDSLHGYLDLHQCNNDGCPNGCNAVSASGNSPTKCLSFHLLRSDGSAYVSGGDALIASVELCFVN